MLQFFVIIKVLFNQYLKMPKTGYLTFKPNVFKI